jgi:predicted transposase YbfD/YdcC
MAQYIRGHWSVENQLHWSLDVGMGDDSGLSQKDHAAHNQALLRRMAQQMLQADTSVKAGLKAKRKRAGWDLTYLERVMGLCI